MHSRSMHLKDLALATCSFDAALKIWLVYWLLATANNQLATALWLPLSKTASQAAFSLHSITQIHRTKCFEHIPIHN